MNAPKDRKDAWTLFVPTFGSILVTTLSTNGFEVQMNGHIVDIIKDVGVKGIFVNGNIIRVINSSVIIYAQDKDRTLWTVANLTRSSSQRFVNDLGVYLLSNIEQVADRHGTQLEYMQEILYLWEIEYQIVLKNVILKVPSPTGSLLVSLYASTLRLIRNIYNSQSKYSRVKL